MYKDGPDVDTAQLAGYGLLFHTVQYELKVSGVSV